MTDPAGQDMHDASRFWLERLCASRSVQFLPDSIWRALETDDILAAGVARLLLFTDPLRLPRTNDTDGAWGCTCAPGCLGSRARKPGPATTRKRASR